MTADMRLFEDERAAFLHSNTSSSSARLSSSFSSLFDFEDESLDDSHDPHDTLLHEKPDVSSLRRKAQHILWWIRWHRRPVRQLAVFFLKYTLILIVALLVLTPIICPSYQHPPSHYHDLEEHCRDLGWQGHNPAASGCANAFNETVFIAVSLIYENDSGVEGAAALQELRKRVPCRSEIVYDEHVAMDTIPNITMPDGTVRTKRLAYLTEIRNRSLRPLDTLDGVGATRFDKIFFLNDVAFRPLDAAHLLFSTNVGSDGRTEYLSVCSVDWKIPWIFYDAFALRDAEGYADGMPLFPIFSGAGAGLSRSDMLHEKDAVRVTGCWGGMVAMQAAYVQNTDLALPRPDFQDIGSHVIDPDRPTAISSPVRFRYEPEIFVDACECCLFLADVSQAARVSGAPETSTGVFVNPYVRVTYDWGTLLMARAIQRWERLFIVPQFFLTPYHKMPANNPHRTVQEGDTFVEEVWDATTSAWKLVHRTGRSGMFCVVREMLLMRDKRKGDRNWERAAVPGGRTLDFPAPY
ncbi:hypothetical protein CMQ_3434 [Grosmannia clavigera kw1407]|uniref:Glycosyltransferase family 69 protein n=1 Tax=Grosmannia clavigera (strain kw1407 / UAMH 11150) TaxID=655863 RepID=F0X911_GROCL|nr:uncharacterized protein CMQ_3434 [Grosmannia clavigera kw1407]EFX05365.1 hypothetical protein CMQ_3434 [Grosmannia clavigera kw1407]